MSKWDQVKIGEYLTESKFISLKPDPLRRITVRLNAKGVDSRFSANEKTGATKYYRRTAGQFIYGRQNLHKGAFGVIPAELDGFESSADLPCFDIKKGLSPDWLIAWLKVGNRYQTLAKLARGVGSKRISPDDFLNLEIPVPPEHIQRKKLSLLSKYEEIIESFNYEQTSQCNLFKKLRQAVLQEAIQGKLTAEWRRRNPELISGENHASKLLEKIKAEKERLIKEGKIRKEKPVAPITDAEKPFDLPEGWVWCRLEELCKGIFTGPFGSMLHKSDYVQNGIPIVNPTHIINGQIVADGRMRISEKTKQRLKRYLLLSGDLVIARRGDLSKCAVVLDEQKGWLCGTGSFFVRCLCINRSYVRLAYISQKAQAYLLQDSIGQTMDNLNQKMLRKLPMGLAPVAEQQAIVERVDKIMAMIDDLENQVAERREQADMLMQAVLREAFS
ncbi:MAG: restriction endonuclease subunit S [Nitrospiraceae bacterium]|nr:restriction endonuclease subunit S [Nitrospiraceae bacterium]